MNTTVNTALGNVEVTNVSMTRASGYGQYSIDVTFLFEGKTITTKTHSTNSQLFDTLTDLDSNSERMIHLLANSKFIIESAIEDYINSL